MQTSYSLNPDVAKAGMIADSRILKHIRSRICEGTVIAGYGVFRAPTTGDSFSNYGGDPGSVYQNPSPAAAASVNAILATGGVSTAGTQAISGTSLNGAVGSAKMYPPRLFTVTFNSHADWDATNLVVTGELDGVTVTDTLAIPNNGNATVTGVQYFDKITSWTIPAQSGTNGTYTAGVAILDASVTLADFSGFAVFDPALVPNTIPSQDQTAEYHDKDIASIMFKGAIWCVCENAFTQGGDVYVRVGSGSGGSTFGQVRATDTDSSTAIAITGARFGNTGSAGGLAKIELY